MGVYASPLCESVIYPPSCGLQMLISSQHVASNTFTRYRPFPTPAQFAASDDLQKRATAWLRREFRVFPTLEIEVHPAPLFLSTHRDSVY
jgi:hypothetical protein